MCLLGFGLAEESTRLTSILSAELKIGSLAVVIGVILIVMTTLNCCFTIDGSSVFYYIVSKIKIIFFLPILYP
jgi:hypothetical protein